MIVVDSSGVDRRISENLAEVRARIDSAAGETERWSQVEEAMEAVSEDAIDLLDRVGWLEKANDVLTTASIEERFEVLVELFDKNLEGLKNDARMAGVEDQHAVSNALLESMAEIVTYER